MIAHYEFLEYARLMLTVRQRFSVSADCATTRQCRKGEDELPAGQLAPRTCSASLSKFGSKDLSFCFNLCQPR